MVFLALLGDCESWTMRKSGWKRIQTADMEYLKTEKGVQKQTVYK